MPAIKPICKTCGYLNKKSTAFYKCRVKGLCPAFKATPVQKSKIIKDFDAPPLVQEKKVLPGQLRLRKEWQDISLKLKSSSDCVEALELLYDLLLTPKYACAKAVPSEKLGRPDQIKWVRDHKSVVLGVTFAPHVHIRDLVLPSVLDDWLNTLLVKFKSNKQPVVVQTQAETANTERVLVLYYDYVVASTDEQGVETFEHAIQIQAATNPGFFLSGQNF